MVGILRGDGRGSPVPGSAATVVAAVAGACLVLSSCSSTDDTLADHGSTDLSTASNEYVPASDPGAVPGQVKERPDTFVTMINSAGGVFLPGFYDNAWDDNASAPIFSGLVARRQDGTVVPDLAESWDVSDDQLTYTFHLRDDLRFSDGEPLTADDVKFTLTLYNDPEFSGDVDFTNTVIEGAAAYRDGDADEISGIRVLDDETVEVATEKVNPLALEVLGGRVLPEHYYGPDYSKGDLDYLRDLYDAPVGAGPYTLDRYVPGQEIRYAANDEYYGGRPEVGHVIFRIVSNESTLPALESGDIDHGFTDSDPEALDTLTGLGFLDVETRINSDFGQVWLNNDLPRLADPDVRRALYHGLDREQVAEARSRGRGEVASVYSPPTLWSYTDPGKSGVTTYDFDPGRAGELLDAAGWKVGDDGIREKDGERFTLRYVTDDRDDALIPVAEQNYRDIGIDFIPETLDTNTVATRLKDGDFEALGSYTSGLHDPDDAVREFGTDDPRINRTGYDNERVRDLVQAGQDTVDQEERQRIYTDLYRELSEDPPTILLDYRSTINVWNTHVGGVRDFQTGSGDVGLVLAGLTTGDGGE